MTHSFPTRRSSDLAFKERGALNKLLSLSHEQRSKGVIAASAGNHSQGVAYHAARLGIPTTIVMPRYTPVVKVEQTEGHGRSEEHTSELQSLMRISYAVFCLKNKKHTAHNTV